MTQTTISILLPTRGRKQACIKSITSLLSKANKPENIEILIGIDNDDQESMEYFKEPWIEFLKQYKTKSRVAVFEKLGYLNLFQYVNALSVKAQGTHIMFWNDDAEMLTKNWDKQIHKHRDYWGLLRMPCINQPHPFALFPIIPTAWVKLFGCVSAVNHSDWWVYNVCKPLDRVQDIAVEVQHNRADVNGENADDTFDEQSYILDGRSPNDVRDYSHPERIKDLANWQQTLMLYGYPHKVL